MIDAKQIFYDAIIWMDGFITITDINNVVRFVVITGTYIKLYVA